jgi:hypothetical protein
MGLEVIEMTEAGEAGTWENQHWRGLAQTKEMVT